MGHQDGSLETVGCVASSQGRRRPLGSEVRGWEATPEASQLDAGAGRKRERCKFDSAS